MTRRVKDYESRNDSNIEGPDQRKDDIMKVLKVMIFGLLASGMTFAAGTAAGGNMHQIALGMDLSLGTLVSVNENAKTLVIKQQRGRDTIAVTDSTLINIQGKTAALADLVAGSKVVAFYTVTNGVKVAVKIADKILKSAPGAAPATK